MSPRRSNLYASIRSYSFLFL